MRMLTTLVLLAFCLAPAYATSIVALIQPNRILLAADSRAVNWNPWAGSRTRKPTR